MTTLIPRPQDPSRPLPPGPYRCIVADPPWSYRNKKTGGSMTSGALFHYSTLTNADLEALPVCNLVDREKGTVLFLWATTPMLEDAFWLMRAWGFTYKTTLYWEKIGGRLGMGHWFRGNVETCIVGITSGVRAFHCQLPNIIHAPPTKHSRKPDAFFDLVEPILDRDGLSPRLELFAREPRSGWDAWGDEVAS